ncbi:YfcL family protein [Vibrio gallicus]|uniref:YfcL family protein n=1 Tax=Vibrio gallicus TaxID=190897 RepID=UPI0021C3D4A3|nr:YfcL family protein [Vibrio gallicus]
MILQLEEQLLEYIDQQVVTASDDELFAGGYLRGHISLAAADCESEAIFDVAEFKLKIEQSLKAAQAELTPADRVIVSDMWDSLSHMLS